ncbi:MAG: hypothetical protein J6A36_01720 [Clostridia bacterium]|nr:hypothetical protein [Clostridia bacterium]
MNNIDFNVSNLKEKYIVGSIKFFNGEHIAYFNETDMLKDFRETWNNVGMFGIQNYNVFPTDDNERHGLQYELIKEQYEQLGLEYTKLDYMSNYVNNKENSENDNLDIELVR